MSRRSYDLHRSYNAHRWRSCSTLSSFFLLFLLFLVLQGVDCSSQKFLKIQFFRENDIPSSLQFSSFTLSPNAMSPVSIIEHLVLFKVRDSTDPSKIDAMVSSQRSLSSLDFVPHLAAGPIHSRRSPAADFTHLLHSRFLSKPDLAAYNVHPSHLAVVHQNAPIIEDVFSVDWVADLDGNIVPSPGSAIMFLIAKPREGTLAAEVVKAIDGVGASKESWGVNFSQSRAKGYEVGLLLGFSGVEEMDGARGEEEIEAIEERIRDLVDSIIVVDFVVPF